MILDKVEPHLKNLLQRNVRFRINNKTVREGRLMLYHIKDFYLSFTLRTEKHPSKVYEIPCPYEISSNGSTLYFHYENDIIYKKDHKTKLLINSLHKNVGKKSKFFDNTILIETENLV